MNELFGDIMEPDFGVNNAPEDGTQITQVILYFDAPDAVLLKKLAKEVMKAEWPADYIDQGNLSKLFLHLVQKSYAKINP